MNRYVRLYPRAWRDRYEAEFHDLLAERRASPGDAVDLIRGAVDAHLHPHLTSGLPEPPWTHRIPGLIALSAGAAWSATVLYLLAWTEQSTDWGGLVVLAGMVMVVSLPGDYMAAHGRQIAVGLALVAASAVATALLPWPVLAIPLLAMYLLVLTGMLVLAGIRAGIGVTGRWRILVAAIGLPCIPLVPVSIGLASPASAPWLGAAILLPYGLAWTAIGLRLTIRGSATFVDGPPPGPATEGVGA
jgi:hypothetical protein